MAINNKMTSYTTKRDNRGKFLQFQYPQECPQCGRITDSKEVLSVEVPQIIGDYSQLHGKVFLTKCCNSRYFVLYGVDKRLYKTEVLMVFPRLSAIDIPANIKTFSPDFVELANQAHDAETSGALALAAGGYRNAVQILVVDYARRFRGATDENLRGPDGQYLPIFELINRYVDNEKFRESAFKLRLLSNLTGHDSLQFEQSDFDDMKRYMSAFVKYVDGFLDIEGMG